MIKIFNIIIVIKYLIVIIIAKNIFNAVQTVYGGQVAPFLLC